MVSRRMFLGGLAASGAMGLAYVAQTGGGGSDPAAMQALDAPVTFGEWELMALDIKNATLLVIDPMEEKLLAQLDVGGQPTGLLHSGNGLAVVVDANAKRITLFRRREQLERVRIDVDVEPSLVAISPDGTLFAVLDRTTGDLAFIRTEDGLELDRKTGLTGAYSLMFDGFGERLFVTRQNTPDIHVFDPRTFLEGPAITVPGASGFDSLIPVGGDGYALAVPPVTNQAALYLIDLNTAKIVRTITVPSPVAKVALSPRGDWLYAASASEPAFYRRSVFGDYQATVRTDGLIRDMVLDGIGQWLGVFSPEAGSISLYATANNALESSQKLPGHPGTVTYHTWSQKTLVTLADAGAIWLMDNKANVRLISVDNASPALITTAGSALCHA